MATGLPPGGFLPLDPDVLVTAYIRHYVGGTLQPIGPTVIPTVPRHPHQHTREPPGTGDTTPLTLTLTTVSVFPLSQRRGTYRWKNGAAGGPY